MPVYENYNVIAHSIKDKIPLELKCESAYYIGVCWHPLILRAIIWKRAKKFVYCISSESEGNLPSEGICTLIKEAMPVYGNYDVIALRFRVPYTLQCRAKWGEVGTYSRLKYTSVRMPLRWWQPRSLPHLFKQFIYFYLITYYIPIWEVIQTLVFPTKFQGLRKFL